MHLWLFFLLEMVMDLYVGFPSGFFGEDHLVFNGILVVCGTSFRVFCGDTLMRCVLSFFVIDGLNFPLLYIYLLPIFWLCVVPKLIYISPMTVNFNLILMFIIHFVSRHWKGSELDWNAAFVMFKLNKHFHMVILL